MQFQQDAFEPTFEQATLAQLDAGFRLHGLRACSAPAQARPLVELRVSVVIEQPFTVELQVLDDLTKKSLSRRVVLERYHAGARALALAVAAEELVRASWAELSMNAAVSPKSQTAEQEAPAHGRSAPSARLPRTWLGAEFALESYGIGSRYFGGDLTLAHALTPSVGVELAAGYRRAEAESSSLGEVHSKLVGAGLSAPFWFWHSQSLRFGPVVGLRVSRATLDGVSANDAVHARSQVAWSLFARGAVQGSLRLFAPIWLRLCGGVGGPLVAAVALSDTDRVAGLAGVEWFSSVGLGGAL